MTARTQRLNTSSHPYLIRVDSVEEAHALAEVLKSKGIEVLSATPYKEVKISFLVEVTMEGKGTAWGEEMTFEEFMCELNN